MNIFSKQSSKQRIKALLIMLFSAIIGAILLILGGLYYYGPTASYIIDHMIIPKDVQNN